MNKTVITTLHFYNNFGFVLLVYALRRTLWRLTGGTVGILCYRQDMRKIRKLVPGWGDEREFADKLFGKLFAGGCQVTQAIRQAFVNDDIFDGVATYQVWRE